MPVEESPPLDFGRGPKLFLFLNINYFCVIGANDVMEAPPGSVSPGAPLGREWQQTVYGPCLPLWDWQEDSALRPVIRRGALRLQEAAHWHQVRIE